MSDKLFTFRPEEIGALFTQYPYMRVLCALVRDTGLTSDAHQLAVMAAEMAAKATGLAHEVGKFFERDVFSPETVVYQAHDLWVYILAPVPGTEIWCFKFQEQCPIAERLVALNDPEAKKYAEGHD